MAGYIRNLPDVASFRARLKGLAKCDAILSPDGQYRHYNYDPNWASGEVMASAQNGSGDDVFVLFKNDSAFIKGWAHEYPSSLSPEAYYAGIPDALSDAVHEPAFSPQNVSYCLWRSAEQSNWTSAVSLDSLPSAMFNHFACLDGRAETYAKFCREYYEVDVQTTDIEMVFSGLPLSQDLILRLNPEAEFSNLSDELAALSD